MSERALWRYIQSHLRALPEIDMQRHEDKLALGVPDVSYGCRGVNGWIELKFCHEPAKTTSLVRCPHFTLEQRQWLLDRGRRGGHAFLLAQVGREYLLMDHLAAQLLGHARLSHLRMVASRVWRQSICFPELLDALTAPSGELTKSRTPQDLA